MYVYVLEKQTHLNPPNIRARGAVLASVFTPGRKSRVHVVESRRDRER